MNDIEKQLEDKLVKITDAYLAGQTSMYDEALSNEIRVIQMLNETIAPTESLSAAFKKRVEYRLSVEWDQHYPEKTSSKPVIHWRTRRVMLRVAAILTTALILVMLLLSFWDNAVSSDKVTGTAIGDFSPQMIVFALLGLILVIIFAWRQKS